MDMRLCSKTGSASFLWTFLYTSCMLCIMAEETCRLPRDLRGKWYWNVDRFLGAISIKEREISRIGTCIQHHHGDRYILQESLNDEVCYKCLLFIRRDNNVLQYRESFCDTHQNYGALCNSINVEMTLYTLIRVSPQPSQCPSVLNGQLSISYKNHTDIDCFSLTSKMTSCASGKQLHFHFGACSTIGTTTEQEFTVDCLASWKDGAMYMYGRIIYGNGSTNDDTHPIHRCFVYEEDGPGLRMSISADASCVSFMSMTLTKSFFGDRPTCAFPTWMQDQKWLDFSGQFLYHVTTTEMLVTKYKNEEDTGRVIYRYSCLTSHQNSLMKIIMLLQVSHRCSLTYQCVQYQPLSAGVIEMSQGAKMGTSNADCLHLLSNRNTAAHKVLLIKENINRVDECALNGVYKTGLVQPPNNQHKECSLLSVHAGCTIPSKLTLYAEDARGQIYPESYRCVAQWSREDKDYNVIRNVKHGSHTCLVLSHSAHQQSTFSFNDVCQYNKRAICDIVNESEPCSERGISSEDASKENTIHAEITVLKSGSQNIQSLQFYLITFPIYFLVFCL